MSNFDRIKENEDGEEKGEYSYTNNNHSIFDALNTQHGEMGRHILELYRNPEVGPLIEAIVDTHDIARHLDGRSPQELHSIDGITEWLTRRANFLPMMGSPLVGYEMLYLLYPREEMVQKIEEMDTTRKLKTEEEREEWQELLDSYRNIAEKMVAFWKANNRERP